MCTSFCAFVSPYFAVTGRSLDFDQPSTFTTGQFKKGYTFKSVLNNGISWTATQGIYTIDFVGSKYNIPFEGLNQAGLSMSGNLANAKYPSGFPTTISSDDLINYVLSQASTIGEAADLMSHISIDSKWQYHYIVFDNQGGSLVVEYENGQAVMYFNESNILTNNPNLHYQLENQNNYTNIRNYAPDAVLPDSGDQFHGQGMLGIPGDWMSPARFTRTYYILKYCLNRVSTSNNDEQVFFAKRVIEAASLMKGIDLGKSASGLPIYTQIQIVKDLIKGVVYTREYGSEDWKSVQVSW